MKVTGDSQLDLNFPDSRDQPSHSVAVLGLPDSDISFYSQFFGKEESDSIFHDLIANAEWSQETMKYYGKEVKLPRLTAWYGDKGASYTYSSISNEPHPWTSTLLYIETRIEPIAGVKFNSVLLNLYRDGNDSVSWHQDNESELGVNPVIASLSFGGTRRFQLRHKFKKDLPRVDLDLTHGSLLIMKGTTQQFWQHQIARTSKPVEPRINLTFRVIYPS
jgi:alkylated DNA repair dioxygenase AlkB